MAKWLKLILLAVLCFLFVENVQGGLRVVSALRPNSLVHETSLRKPIYIKSKAADPGEPLFLTPYIKNQEFQTGMVVVQYSVKRSDWYVR